MKSLDLIEHKYRSQHGEDGIIEYLISCLPSPTKRFVEIGCGSGKENCTSHLAENGWRGVVFDSKPSRIEMYREYGYDADAHCIKAQPSTVSRIHSKIGFIPDFFSLDIDSWDFHVFKQLLQLGFKPDILCLEYNSTYMQRPIATAFPPQKRANKRWYFGCSVEAWKRLLHGHYQFVTVDSSGTNAFFFRKSNLDRCSHAKLFDVEWLEWADSFTDGIAAQTRWNKIKYNAFEWVKHDNSGNGVY